MMNRRLCFKSKIGVYFQNINLTIITFMSHKYIQVGTFCLKTTFATQKRAVLVSNLNHVTLPSNLPSSGYE